MVDETPPEFLEVPDEVKFELPTPGVEHLGRLNRETIINLDYSSLNPIHRNKSSNEKFVSQAIGLHFRNMAIASRKFGVNAIPLYPSINQFTDEFLQGSSIAYQAALSNIPVVSDDDLDWKQVLSFRNDKEAHWKYRALKVWLVDALSAKSVSEASDIIAKKLDDYEWSLKKHGLKTITGVITDILSSECLVAILASGGIVGLIAGPTWSALTSGTIAVARVSISIAERLIDLEDVKRGPGAEVAIIYEARKRLGDNLG